MNANTDVVPLKDAISSLRNQIRAAAAQAASLPASERFRITSVELELTVVAEDTATVGGEVGWWIFKAKAEGAAKDAVTHKVKLTLNVGDIEVAAQTKTA